MKLKTEIGTRWGRLTVTAVDEPARFGSRSERRLLCRCDCGNEKRVLSMNLISGNTKSCGCYRVDFGLVKNRTHGQSRSATYNAYRHMISRCYNPNVERYAEYGGRGIKVCERWLGDGGFERFLADMGEKPARGISIDRIDVNGDYEPGNVRWADGRQQANNKRTTVRVMTSSGPMTLAEAARAMGLRYATAYAAYRRGDLKAA